MKILINDANILIDLVKISLLNRFSDLSYELFTTDFILAEVNQAQRKEIVKLIGDAKINLIVTTEMEDFQGIYNLLEESSGLSFQDCSAWYYSKKMNGTLITGDRKLRKTAEIDGVEVRGIIYIMDEILRQGIISFEDAIQKIELLFSLNNRLPHKELTKRINLWKKQKHVEQ